jgi:FAD/FMN-containing dehydrogenase
MANPQSLSGLTKFLEEKAIPYHLPSSSEYPELQKTFTSSLAQPSVILRPANAKHVSLLVAQLVSDGLPFTVRTGGHDLSGRSIMQDTVQIDMRDINYVHVSDDKTTARIGGGILHGKLLEELAPHDLMIPVGSIGTVGYVGWSCLGGYGPYSPSCGLGLDQIVGARLVNAEGKEVEADDRLLKFIRGGGGNFGVIVELTVKVYPCTEVTHPLALPFHLLM